MQPFPRQLTVVDLFSGTGAATKAFKDRGHRVITVDIDPKLKPDIVADVRYLPFADSFRPDVVWASPPCQDFSNINHRNWKRLERGGWPEAGFETYTAACDAIARLDPKWWIIENVRGAARWWGAPTKRVGKGPNAPWLLWGRFPPFDTGRLLKGFYALFGTDENGNRVRLPGAKPVPTKQASSVHYSLSLALCLAIELWEAP